jgi:predicted acetyltransferase
MAKIDGPRACNKAELSDVISLVNQSMRQGSDQSMLTDYPLVYQDRNLENISVLKVNDELAAVVPFLIRNIRIGECNFTVGIISPTATAPHHQRKGYGLQCLKRCVELMNRNNCDLSVLWTKVETFPFYEKGGYQAVRDQGWVYHCSTQDARFFQDHGENIVQLQSTAKEHLKAIQQMHERDVYGVLRASDDYPVLFSLPKMKTFLALRAGVPVGYLLLSNAINKPGIIEAGGDQHAVETLNHRTLSGLKDDQQVCAYAYRTETALGNLVEEKMSRRKQPGGSAMMIRINDIGGFCNKIASYWSTRNQAPGGGLIIQLTDTGERIYLQGSDKNLTVGEGEAETPLKLSRQQLTAVVFGAHPSDSGPIPDVIRHLVPFYFPIWILDRS